ncbi:hypothetical protein RHSIM_Rhsim11G0080100 [Rhododendron simsii]|uniref:non-specific serine/threonine protein kinase n=1 Tax=Rhododendron simsii TaxID=118357 RepID=A0A834LAT9_RHOSS|nr:hypothetical protein RHSIM_Rhsim11G0080100 [Rhododendron simsii]
MNTVLPNMKLGLDLWTGLEWSLTSWKSGDDPGTGEYSYRVEPNELPQLIQFKGSTRVWRIPECDSNNRQEFECTCLPQYEPRSVEEWYLRDASGGCIKKREAISMCGNREGFVKPGKFQSQANVSTVSYSTQLLDSGNLVLFQGDSGSGGVVWQSFDHPTNTLLPNMKLGLDRRTGLQRFLTSWKWKSRDDPSTGEYSLRLELNELPQLILFKGLKPMINLDEVYASYILINASNLSTMFVDELGSLKMVIWVGKWVEFHKVPGDQCGAYGRCGAYGYCDSNNGKHFECTCLPAYEPRSAEEWNLRDASDGCIKKREELSMCINGGGFVKVANAKIPDTSKARVWMGLSMHECKDECLRNCSCLAYTSTAEGEGRVICVT